MKLIIAILAVAVTVQISTLGAAPVITAPTPGQVFYKGEPVEITWNPAKRETYGGIAIELLDENGKTLGPWLAYSTPNDGSFTWTAENRSTTGDSYVIRIWEEEAATVQITIIDGVRPPVEPPVVEPTPVTSSVTLHIHVNWPMKEGHLYELKKSSDLITWSSAYTVSSSFTGDGYFPIEVKDAAAFYTVTDITPP